MKVKVFNSASSDTPEIAKDLLVNTNLMLEEAQSTPKENILGIIYLLKIDI